MKAKHKMVGKRLTRMSISSVISLNPLNVSVALLKKRRKFNYDN